MKTPSKTPKVGIDDMVAYLPDIYLPIEDLAEARNIEYAKLNKGLGLSGMSFPDVGEDAATMAANAVRQLIEQNDLDPRQIGRLYVGTESALDGSKPTATYVIDMLSQYFEPTYGPDCFLHCDVVDLTFACIGAVDALQNTIDWAGASGDRIGIVVGTDVAKYDLASTGEYTQGAGAVALLVKQAPRLLAFGPNWGTACKSVHDFFKPRRKFSKEDIIDEVLHMAGIQSITGKELLSKLNGHLNGTGVISMPDAEVYLHKETPVFDGPYSNDCYQARIKEALVHFAKQEGLDDSEVVTDEWARLIFHLPYAYQARRMFSEIFVENAKLRGNYEALLEELGMPEPVAEDYEETALYQKAKAQFYRAVTKTNSYRKFVTEKIEKGERASSLVGNLYTSSIFLSLMSTLEADWQDGVELTGRHLGFFAYGSGSKSKVFQAELQEDWKAIVARFKLFETLDNRQKIDYRTYEYLHRGKIDTAVKPDSDRFSITHVRTERDDQEGARTYAWTGKVAVKHI